MRTTVIMEIGSNFSNLQDIKDSIEFAKSLGCIPKLQAFKAEELAEPRTSYYDQLKKSEVPREWMVELKDSGVFYSVFGLESLAFLEAEVKPSMYKIASGKAVDEGLIKAVASLHKPTYLSVGGCSLDEIRQAVKWYEKGAGDPLWWTRLTLMHTMVAYKKCDMQLAAFRDRVIGSKLLSWGWSQNYSTEENLHLPSVAVALGGSSCEVHFKLDHIKDTPDTGHSLNPEQFTKMVNLINTVEENMGNTERPTVDEADNLKLARGR